MDVVSESSKVSLPTDEIEARIAKLAVDVDSLAVLLPKAFAKSRLETVRSMAKSVAELSQVVLLSMKLNRPPMEILETVESLRGELARLRLMCSRTRVDQGTLLSIVLMERLTESMCADLAAWRAPQETA